MPRCLALVLAITLALASLAHARIEVEAGDPGITNLKNTFVVKRAQGDTTTNLKARSDRLSVSFCALPQPAGTDCVKPLTYSLCARSDCPLP